MLQDVEVRVLSWAPKSYRKPRSLIAAGFLVFGVCEQGTTLVESGRALPLLPRRFSGNAGGSGSSLGRRRKVMRCALDHRYFNGQAGDLFADVGDRGDLPERRAGGGAYDMDARIDRAVVADQAAAVINL